MVANYGTVVPSGSLPVYSVDTEDEAKMLLTMCCPRLDSGWLAEELAKEQTLENLELFGERLRLADNFVKAKTAKSKQKAKDAFFKCQMEMKKSLGRIFG